MISKLLFDRFNKNVTISKVEFNLIEQHLTKHFIKKKHYYCQCLRSDETD